jgi:hypothetical protein
LLLGGDYRLTPVAPFPDPGTRDEFGAAAAALFRHRLLKGENTRLFGQQMGIVEIAMIHVRHTFLIWEHCRPSNPELGVMAQQLLRA